MEEIKVNSAEVPWEPVQENMQRKILQRGPDGAPRVALLQLQAGFEMAAHSHSRAENHYILEGAYQSHGHEFVAGLYRRIPSHSEHGPFTSSGGALVLVFWE